MMNLLDNQMARRDRPRMKGLELMKNSFRGRRPRSLAALAGLAVGVALLLPATAMAATTDPITIAVSYTSPAVNPGAPNTIVYTVSNSGAATSYVNFTDELPGGVTIDGLPSETWGSGCGTNNDTNAGGASSVTVANLEVAAGGSCTVSLSVDTAASAVGQTEVDTLTALSWAASLGGTTTPAAYLDADETTPVPLQVVANPTIQISGVKSGATYRYGQLVPLNYTATAASADAIASLAAFDDDGDTLNPGTDIDTLEPGKHSVSVEVNTVDGASITDTVKYTIAPPVIAKLSVSKREIVSFEIALPWAGKLSATLFDGKKSVGSVSEAIKAKETAAVSVKLNAAGQTLLRRAGSKGLRLALKAVYAPSATLATGWPTASTANGYTPGKATASANVTVKR